MLDPRDNVALLALKRFDLALGSVDATGPHRKLDRALQLNFDLSEPL